MSSDNPDHLKAPDANQATGDNPTDTKKEAAEKAPETSPSPAASEKSTAPIVSMPSENTPAPEKAVAEKTEAPKAAPPPAAAQEITILVVDDLADMRSLLGLTLNRNGWQVIEASDGAEAVELARSKKPSLILMDYDMPAMNGLEACKKITTEDDTKNIPVVIYTGHSGFNMQEDVLAAGARVFLLKPIPPRQLRDTIKELLASE